MSTLEILEKDLERAKIERDKVVAPYNDRIKFLSTAITNVKKALEKEGFINSRGEERVIGLDCE